MYNYNYNSWCVAVSLLEKDLSNIEALRELRVELKHLKDVSV